jgi:hypothetical protein
MVVKTMRGSVCLVDQRRVDDCKHKKNKGKDDDDVPRSVGRVALERPRRAIEQRRRDSPRRGPIPEKTNGHQTASS